MVIINPGTGPVENATEQEARKNISVLITDAGLNPRKVKVSREKEWDEDGRFGYRLHRLGQHCDVEMPGLPIEQVRYIDRETQNIWHFPRLYIDGSSWVWFFAINFVREDLTGGSYEQLEDEPLLTRVLGYIKVFARRFYSRYFDRVSVPLKGD